MASLHRDAKSPNWSINFRFAGKQYIKSLKTKDEREAGRLKARIEVTIADIERGRLEVPEGADFWAFVRSDGRLAAAPVAPEKPVTLAALFDLYFASQFGQKEANTLRTERFHRQHLERVLGGGTPVRSITGTGVQSYVAERAAAVKPDTVKREVATLRMVLNRAERLTGRKPAADVREMFRGLSYPKGAEKPGFMSWAEIDDQVRRTRPDASGAKDLWDRLFLSVEEVEAFLDWAEVKRSHQPVPYMPPLLTAAAHTGARFSELARSRVEDWDFPRGVVVLREKKKSQKGATFRRVPLSPRLAARMRRWFDGPHPGGGLAFGRLPDEPLDGGRADTLFKRFARGSRWAVLRGYHVFRHSFASNLARAGVDERVVDELMGHQTAAMRKRYRHFFPDQRQNAVQALFGGGDNPSASTRTSSS